MPFGDNGLENGSSGNPNSLQNPEHTPAGETDGWKAALGERPSISVLPRFKSLIIGGKPVNIQRSSFLWSPP